jgi:hypothetical protein
MMIVKLQRALMPPDGPVLGYDQRREHEIRMPMTRALSRLFGDEVKVFVDAEFCDGLLQIKRRVANQGW